MNHLVQNHSLGTPIQARLVICHLQMWLITLCRVYMCLTWCKLDFKVFMSYVIKEINLVSYSKSPIIKGCTLHHKLTQKLFALNCKWHWFKTVFIWFCPFLPVLRERFRENIKDKIQCWGGYNNIHYWVLWGCPQPQESRTSSYVPTYCDLLTKSRLPDLFNDINTWLHIRFNYS